MVAFRLIGKPLTDPEAGGSQECQLSVKYFDAPNFR
jgi:hypothetical protein